MITRLRPSAPPPLPGMLARQMGIAVRAYGRRAGLLRPAYTVRALKAVDQRLDALMDVCRYYGPACLDEVACVEAQAQTRPEEIAGAAFVRIALAERHEPDASVRLEGIARLLAAQPMSVRDALWFYAAPPTCGHLLASDDAHLLACGVELAGRLALPEHIAGVHAAAVRGADPDACLLACARMGQVPPRAEEQWKAVLQGQDLARQITALQALGTMGGHRLQPELRHYIDRITAADDPTEQSHPVGWAAAADAALALWAAREPETALGAVLQGLRVPNDTALRVAALAGRIEGLLPVLDFIERQDRPVEPGERDLLRLVFGQVPGELTNTQGTARERQRALRVLACQVFAANGCTGLEPAHITRWTDAALKDRLWALDAIRIRSGGPITQTHRLAPTFDVGHALRSWLYVEHAAVTHRPFPLSHEDLAARQMAAVETVQLMDSLQADPPAP
ncbi:hypothetical protein AVHY2522_22325 [Acidovorax sp. SUPP2522]|uniref:hypothetical protein n=1 Tax=unclassified Acidovorax TaxID=2684926 RepID=UPI00234B5C29|nr:MULTISPECIES: hypothetical protein [unclassified Acidovorax]WCM96506.1 hypothetical protein M5C96_19035 [Acidovorax sp. GBBC 1281]GKT19398.1 hypothetical protein AVHY2522_22325 [Acidovorax sp. SUPP2522]